MEFVELTLNMLNEDKQKKRYPKVSLFALQDGLEPTTP